MIVPRALRPSGRVEESEFICEDVFGGQAQTADGGEAVICSGVDQADTFCILNSRDVFPCPGLFKHGRDCNGFNRPAVNPYICGTVCVNQEAAGGRCIDPPPPIRGG